MRSRPCLDAVRTGRVAAATCRRGTQVLRNPLMLVLLSVGVWFEPTDAAAARAQTVAAGSSHTCAVTSVGGVRCWGYNNHGQLGDGTTTDRLTPTDVPGLTSGVVAVAAGTNHTCAVTAGGGVKCWGQNYAGQVGDGTTTTRLTPTDVSGLTSGVVAVAGGASHTCALTTGGGVRCWGNNTNGQLGDGTTTQWVTPTDVSGLTSGVAAISAGGAHTCAVTIGGGAKCWGYNSFGQIGDGTTTQRLLPVEVVGLTSDVGAVSAAGYQTCAVTTGGGVKCWGMNTYGQLGDGTTTQRLTPTDVSGLASGAVALAGMEYQTCVVTPTGGMKCWGYNNRGQLGDGTTTNQTTPTDVSGLTVGVAAVAVGGSHTCAVTAGGGVRCWGSNSHGQVGDGSTTTRTAPVDVPGLTSGVGTLVTGGSHTCAVTAGGGVKCWGDNTYGQVGDGTTSLRLSPTDLSGLTSGVTAIAAGYAHTCAVTTGGSVMCWGLNASGQLGDGTTTNRTTPTDVPGLTSDVVMVGAGSNHTCAMTTGGGVKCWGYNGQGQLGDGTTTNRMTPTDVSGLTSGVAAVAAGGAHACALTTTGGVKCWGYNGQGQLGDGTTTNRATPTDVSGLTSGVGAVAVGGSFTCALTTTGGVKCWGYNTSGQLGDGTTTNRATPADVSGLTSGALAVSAGDYHTCAVTTVGGLKCWGQNAYGQLGDGTFTQRSVPEDVLGLSGGVAAAAAGHYHVCAVTTGGGAKCWGDGSGGQLGDSAYGPRLTPVRSLRFGQIDFDRDDRVDVAVYRPSAGTWFSLDSLTNNTTYQHRGWGVEAQGDTPAPGDYDGDGVIDPTVFRPGTGTWFILESHTAYTTWNWFGWGSATDTLVPGDYDGDGKTDAAVFRAATGTWYVRPSSGATSWSVVFGEAGDEPIAGDFDGDGKRDIAVYRAASGTWFWLKSSSNFTVYDYRGWGVQAQGDMPAPGDYDGDGKTDFCVFRPASGTWFILETHAAFTTWNWFGWGASGDTLVPADFDGDGKTDAAVYRASSGTWYVRPSGGASPWNVVFGQAGDVPLVRIK